MIQPAGSTTYHCAGDASTSGASVPTSPMTPSTRSCRRAPGQATLTIWNPRRLPCLRCEGDRFGSGVPQYYPTDAIEVLAQREMDLPGLIQLLLTDRVAILTTLYDQQPPLCW